MLLDDFATSLSLCQPVPGDEIANSLECLVGLGTQTKDLKIRQDYDYYSEDFAPEEEYTETSSASDLGDISPASYESPDAGSSGQGFDQNTIDQFNQKIAPSLEVGSQVDHSHDGDIGIKVDPFSKQYGGRTGILVGDENFKAGFYTNPLQPQQPPMFAVEGSFK